MGAAADGLLAALRGHDRDRWLAALFAPEPARGDLAAFAAFNWEIARIRETVSEKLLGQIRLQWWREALDGIFAGTPRAHPVAEALARAVARKPPPRAAFERLIDARARDLDDAPFADRNELEAYAEATSAPLLELAVAALGGRCESALADVARDVGTAYGLAGALTAIPYRTAARRNPIPPGRFAVADIAEAARARLTRARQRRDEVPTGLRVAFLIGVLAEARLDDLARAGNDPYAAALGLPKPFRPLRLAWAAWRGRY